jgi:hypothetical protein
MTEEQARANAKVLALGMGITFYVVRSREGRFLPVQLPSDGCEILAMIAPPGSVHDKGWREPGDHSHPGEHLSQPQYSISGSVAPSLSPGASR